MLLLHARLLSLASWLQLLLLPAHLLRLPRPLRPLALLGALAELGWFGNAASSRTVAAGLRLLLRLTLGQY